MCTGQNIVYKHSMIGRDPNPTSNCIFYVVIRATTFEEYIDDHTLFKINVKYNYAGELSFVSATY